MPEQKRAADHTIREMAYFIWEHEGRPNGRAQAHWLQAMNKFAKKHNHEQEQIEDEEKVLAGRADANIPAMLTKDVPGG
jgi:hypothetical protein